MTTIDAAFALFGASLLLAFGRLVRGPSLADRVVALDLMATIAVAMTATQAIAADAAVYLGAALALALVAFLGTIAYARYIEWGRTRP